MDQVRDTDTIRCCIKTLIVSALFVRLNARERPTTNLPTRPLYARSFPHMEKQTSNRKSDAIMHAKGFPSKQCLQDLERRPGETSLAERVAGLRERRKVALFESPLMFKASLSPGASRNKKAGGQFRSLQLRSNCLLFGWSYVFCI